MSKHKEVSPTLAFQGIIDFNLHYGPFACHWWHEISAENGSEFYPTTRNQFINLFELCYY